MKKILTMVSAVLISVLLAGCGMFSDDSEKLLRCPNPGGEYEEITDVLNKELSSDYTLKYAKYGDLRSAFIVSDLDSDGTANEALVFYSTTRGSDEFLNISLFKKESDWKMIGKTAVGGTDIEKLELGDFNGDNILEAVIGWSIYGAPETRLSIFDLSGDIPLSFYESGYNDFTVYDMNSNGKDNLLLCMIDTPSSTVKFSLHEFSKGNITKIAECDADKSITSVRRFVKTKLGSNPTVFVDVNFGRDAYFTEIISYDGERLSAPLYEQSGQTHTLTKRFKDIASQDLDNDGELDIPCQTLLPGADEEDRNLYLTTWKAYSGGTLKVTERNIISASMQYKFNVKKEWMGKITALASASDGIMFYNYSSETGRGEEIFEIKYSSVDNSDAEEQGEIIYSDKENVALAKIYSKDANVEIDIKTITKRFQKMK